MKWPTEAQVLTALRYAGVVAGTLFSGLATLGALSPETSAAIVTQLQLVGRDLQTLVGDGWKLGLLVGPVLVAWLAKIGYHSASPRKQIAAVQAMPEAQVTVTNPKLAEGIPGVQVCPTCHPEHKA